MKSSSHWPKKKRLPVSVLVAFLLAMGLDMSPAHAQQNTGEVKPAYAIDASKVLRPPGVSAKPDGSAKAIAEGRVLFHDAKLGKSGESCATCHDKFNTFTKVFAEPYPHTVGMVKRKAGIDAIHLDEMIQYCMLAALNTDPLPWNSRQLSALMAYVTQYQAEYRKLLAGR